MNPLATEEKPQELPSVEAMAAEIEAIKALGVALMPLTKEARARVVRHVSAYFQIWGDRY